ncbi:MAG: LCP family protein [Acidimicrobiales bacterium]
MLEGAAAVAAAAPVVAPAAPAPRRRPRAGGPRSSIAGASAAERQPQGRDPGRSRRSGATSAGATGTTARATSAGAPGAVARTRAPGTGTTAAAEGGAQVPASRWVKRMAVAALVGIVLLVVGGLGVGWWAFNQIEKVEVADVLSPPSPNGMNILVVGTDSRGDRVRRRERRRLPRWRLLRRRAVTHRHHDDPAHRRRRPDAVVDPRDLWVRNPVTGENGRINAVYQSGRPALIQAVQGLGIPVHHYMEINFVSFAGLVDAVGGIEIDFPHRRATPTRASMCPKPGPDARWGRGPRLRAVATTPS